MQITAIAPAEGFTPVPSTKQLATEATSITQSSLPKATLVLGIGATRISEKDGMVMVYVPAGEFLMGSTYYSDLAESDEKPQHTVYLDAFWIDRTEVTSAMFARFVAATGYKTDQEKDGYGYVITEGKLQMVQGADWQHPSGPNTSVNGLDNSPVEHMSRNDAQAYCRWAGRQLPTEAQWEKAARGTDGRIYPWGNQAATCDYTVMDDGRESCGKGLMPWPVGSKPKDTSPYGVLDMAGNVSEWVADWYDEKYYASSPSKNPEGPPSGQKGVLRGGSWADSQLGCRIADRTSATANAGSYERGFRCAALP